MSDLKKWRKIAEENGINPRTYRSRVTKYGWTPKEAATKPVRKRRTDTMYIKKAQKNGINYRTYLNRVDDLFWSPEDASTIPTMTMEEVSELGNKAKAEYREIMNERHFNDKKNLFNITPQHIEIAKQNNIKKNTVLGRVRNYGWTVQEAITVPVEGSERPEGYFEYLEKAKRNGIRTSTYGERVKRGWPLSKAATVTPNLANGNKRSDYEWVKVAIENGIKRNTYISRIRLGWTKEQAATVPILNKGEYLSEQTKKKAEEGFKKFQKR